MQNFIKNELDKIMETLLTMKKDFVKSLKKKIPSFPAYLVFFKYFKNIIKNIILKIFVSGLHLTERHQRHRLYFADKNNKVYLICNITNSKTNVLSDIDNLSDDDIFQKYFSQFLKNALFNPSTEQITFLNNIIKNKSTSWSIRKEGLETISSRHTPDTLTSSTLDLVSYVANTPITTNPNIFEYVNSNNGTAGIVFSYAGNTSGLVDSNIIFSYIPSGTIFNLLVVGGGGSGAAVGSGGGGGGITYYPNYPITNPNLTIPPTNTQINFMVGAGGLPIDPLSSSDGITGGSSQFDTIISYGGGGGVNSSQQGGVGGSINTSFGGGGGAGGSAGGTNRLGGSNSLGGNVGQSANGCNAGASYYSLSNVSQISVPFYPSSTTDPSTFTKLFLGGGGSGSIFSTSTTTSFNSKTRSYTITTTETNYTASGGLGVGGLLTVTSSINSTPPLSSYNSNGSYLGSNYYGGGACCENSLYNYPVGGTGGNGVVILWWNNV